jgi:hypothetical protein
MKILSNLMSQLIRIFNIVKSKYAISLEVFGQISETGGSKNVLLFCLADPVIPGPRPYKW